MKRSTILAFFWLGVAATIGTILLSLYVVNQFLSTMEANLNGRVYSSVDSIDSCTHPINVTRSGLWDLEALAVGNEIEILDLPSKGVEVPSQLEPYVLTSGEPLFARTGSGFPVANSQFFKSLRVVDATKVDLPIDDSFRVGTLTREGNVVPPRMLLEALLMNELIQTFWHVESNLCLVEEMDTEDLYRAHLTGTHTYFTSEQHIEPINFTFFLYKATGEMYIGPRDLPRLGD